MQIVSLCDVAATVAWGLHAPTRAMLDLMHPEAYALGHIVAEQRRWLGLAPCPVWNLPRPLVMLVGAVADGLGLLGWRSPARSTAFAQLAAAPVGDPAAWIAASGIEPKSLADIFAAAPATVQDRWFARLYFLKPAILAGLSALFIMTGLVSLGPGWHDGMALLAPAGLFPPIAAAIIVGGAILDIALGLALLVRRTARLTLLIMLALSVIYLVIATALDPHLWADPLGRLLKTLPLMLLMLVALATLDER